MLLAYVRMLSWSPKEKLSRKTSTPALSKSERISTEEHLGPIEQTTFVRLLILSRSPFRLSRIDFVQYSKNGGSGTREGFSVVIDL